MPGPMGPLAHRLASLPLVVVGVLHGEVDENWFELCDVVVAAGDPALGAIQENLERFPLTAAALALLLRGQPGRSVDEGLVAESAVYSVLQSGPEFSAWRAQHPVRHEPDDGARVRVKREGPRLMLTLTRPDRLNALDARMRDELIEGLAIAAADPGITVVELRGEGPAFCAGGDLDEFGSRSDPASAHILRLQRSIGREMSNLGARTTAYVHGACVGSGIELAAFTARVVAAADTRIALPEIGLGLVPGAGGTVSLTRRIGRLRTAWLAFSGTTIDAATALEWGLVDDLEP
ncbi:MAG: enoyl-CoA hydratase/isomerase family protein [Acidimicrobiales bacterium]